MSTVIVYSDDAGVRERVRLAIGRRPDSELDPIDWLEANDGGALMTRVREGGIDACILDGEAAPEGGMGLSREIKNEFIDSPDTIVLIGRRDDRWLARWSLADGVVQLPIDPVEITDVVVRLLRERARAKHLPAAAAGDELAPHH